jgi:cell division protein FtsQ
MPGFTRIWNGLMMAGWIILGVGLLTLLVAAMHTKNAKPCTDVVITFKNRGEALYTGKWAISGMLHEKGIAVLKGKPIKSFNLKSMEDRLEKDPWIHNAELFFDNKRVLRVIIEENQPVARVFTLKGNSFISTAICSACRLTAGIRQGFLFLRVSRENVIRSKAKTVY